MQINTNYNNISIDSVYLYDGKRLMNSFLIDKSRNYKYNVKRQ